MFYKFYNDTFIHLATLPCPLHAICYSLTKLTSAFGQNESGGQEAHSGLESEEIRLFSLIILCLLFSPCPNTSFKRIPVVKYLLRVPHVKVPHKCAFEFEELKELT
jgi:hypothetical protein